MGLRQSMRPRHQVLVLKCYPRFQKNQIEVKPNSSELSYLLYYASTRRSKLNKVCEYLEKRTDIDVKKGKLGNVQVTLQIVTALIEKCPRDLPLYASSILTIFSHLLHSGDVNFIEESVYAFTTFSLHYDLATLSADPEHTQRFDELVHTYASFASKQGSTHGKGRERSTLESLRFRDAGLRALHGLVSSEAFGADIKHVKVVLPALLDNLYSHVPGYLRSLQQREGANEQFEKDLSLRRRQSVSAQRSTEVQRAPESIETDPAVASVTTADVDQRAIEEVGVLALKSLRHVFNAVNRGQVRMATTAALNFATKHCSLPDDVDRSFVSDRSQASWATELFELISRWTPVQDRFIILVTAMESLISSPITEADLPRQLLIVSIVSWLLRSSINFIGLSVIDVLVGMIQHTLLLLQLGGKGSSVFPHHQQVSGSIQTARESPVPSSQTTVWGKSSAPFVQEISKEPSAIRKRLLEHLKLCMGDLTTHVYYLDQVGDMVSALFVRLKPSSTTGILSSVAAIEDPNATVDAIADSSNLRERVLTDGFFSFDTARLLALEAVKQILVVANSQRHDGGGSLGRNRVDVSIWEGTQWLLRDPEAAVRRAYVDALLTWLQYEVDKKSFLQAPEAIRLSKSKKTDREHSESILFAKKVLSNASQKLDGENRDQNYFLQLLHLAVYENAIAYAGSQSDILLLHLLLVNLIQKLGVNSLRTGLPMMFRLQDEVLNLTDTFERISVASLVHGFFWAISQCFGFEHNPVGQDIQNEILRRTNDSLWLKGIRLPPTPVGKNHVLEVTSLSSAAETSALSSESLRSFNSREELVNSIVTGYSLTVFSPPTSPHVSPQKSFSRPHFRKLSTSASVPAVEKNLSPKIVGQMLEEWTRETCIATAERERSQAKSLAGSKSGSGSGQRSLHPPDGRAANDSSAPQDAHGRPAAYTGPGGGITVIRPQQRHPSNRSSQTPLGDSSARSIVRVEDLKRVLSGNYISNLSTNLASRTDQPVDDAISESLITASISESDSSVPQEKNGSSSGVPAQRLGLGSFQESIFVTPATTPSEIMREADPLGHDLVLPDEDVPPVPMLPANLRTPNVDSPITANEIGTTAKTLERPRLLAQLSRTEDVANARGWGYTRPAKVDLQALLDGLDTSSKRPSTPMGAAPPY